MGNRQTMITTTIFGNVPKPNHIMKSGAMAIVGMVWDITNIGYKVFFITSKLSMIIASIKDNAMENPNPTKDSYRVIFVWESMRLRSLTKAAIISAGEGSI
ncbi:hypothetical protein SDC9_163934 [bioreactor metagenome]|uniref:Uncharacterized protein n=1 Tax=bioreactor metagenome TaxID=1076179 RepID=A0A645FT19_9ZZZZ